MEINAAFCVENNAIFCKIIEFEMKTSLSKCFETLKWKSFDFSMEIRVSCTFYRQDTSNSINFFRFF